MSTGVYMEFAVSGKRQNELIEGPTRAQVKKMIARRKDLTTKAREAEALGDDLAAFERDAEAFDIECTLRDYYIDPETGRKERN